MNQIKLPNRADVTINLHKFVADSSHLHIGIDEFAECNNIVLQDVYYKDGIIKGTYIKPDTLQYYDDHVDKSVYKTYVSWYINSGDIKKLKFDRTDCDKQTAHAILVEDGRLQDVGEIQTKSCFISSRVGYLSSGMVYMGYV